LAALKWAKLIWLFLLSISQGGAYTLAHRVCPCLAVLLARGEIGFREVLESQACQGI